MHCNDLNSTAEEAGRALEAVDGVLELSCVCIGIPKPCCAFSGHEPCPGTIVALHVLRIGGAY